MSSKIYKTSIMIPIGADLISFPSADSSCLQTGQDSNTIRIDTRVWGGYARMLRNSPMLITTTKRYTITKKPLLKMLKLGWPGKAWLQFMAAKRSISLPLTV